MTTLEYILSGNNNDVWPYPAPVAIHHHSRPLRVPNLFVESGVSAMKTEKLMDMMDIGQSIGLSPYGEELACITLEVRERLSK